MPAGTQWTGRDKKHVLRPDERFQLRVDLFEQLPHDAFQSGVSALIVPERASFPGPSRRLLALHGVGAWPVGTLRARRSIADLAGLAQSVQRFIHGQEDGRVER